MSKNPQDRPTAREVLSSGLLPPRVQDEQVDVDWGPWTYMSCTVPCDACLATPTIACPARLGARSSMPNRTKHACMAQPNTHDAV